MKWAAVLLGLVALGCELPDPGPYDAGTGTVCYDDSECAPNACCGMGTAVINVADGAPDCRAVTCDGKCPANGIKCGCAVPVCRNSRCTSAISTTPGC